MSRTSFIPSLENRHKEIWIKQPATVKYFTIGFIGAFTAIVSIIILMFMTVSPFFLDFSNRDDYGIAELYGHSMSPSMNEGAYLFIQYSNHPAFNASYGDIIVYYDNDAKVYVAHRIVYIINNQIITKGDNNDYYDMPINKTDIQGKVLRITYSYIDKWFYEAWLNLFNWW
ncbi:MAG: signal peptidase I [Thermoplasmata archaeon]|nr:signal peptidase I [Thermoplasmata archaeon]